MTIRLKQRLLAAVVILALIVIFVPMLFKKNNESKMTNITSFPSAPAQPNTSQMTPAVMQENNQEQPVSPQPAMPVAAPAVTAPVATATVDTSLTPPANNANEVQNSASPSQEENVQPVPSQEQAVSNDTETEPVANDSDDTAGQATETEPVANDAGDTAGQATDDQSAVLSDDVTTNESASTPSDQSDQSNAMNSAQQAVLHVPTSQSSKARQVVSVKPTDVNTLSKQPKKAGALNLSQANITDFSKDLHVRKVNVNSNNVAPELTSVQEHQMKVAKAVNNAWVLQLGSFANKANAAKLVKNLRLKGLPAFSYPSVTGHLASYHVYIGPVAHKNQAEIMKKGLAKTFHLSSFVAPFDATHLQ